MARYALILIKWVGRPSKLPRGWLPYRTSIRKTCAVDDRLDHRSGGWAGKACPPERADSPDHLAGRTRRSSSQLRATSGRLHWSLQCPFVAERRWWVQDVQKKTPPVPENFRPSNADCPSCSCSGLPGTQPPWQRRTSVWRKATILHGARATKKSICQ
jgi:hypothetical protein